MSKIALITGANRGLGQAEGGAAAEAGVDLILTYRSSAEEAQTVVDAVTALGRTAVALRLDVADLGSFDAFAEQVRDALNQQWQADRFDFLINNAGVGPGAPFAETSVEIFDELLNVHFRGMYFLTQRLLPLLADGGRIVNLSTGLTRFVGPGYSAYAAMKGAVEVLTRYLAQELGSARGITVNTIAPGPTATDFAGGMMRDNPQVRDALAGQAALGRVGEPADIGTAIATLLGDGTGWITAQRIEVSGGARL
jgi:NAD(P)-dependent dehydrogenase (short-subunit alcohol dehydrogenase family)